MSGRRRLTGSQRVGEVFASFLDPGVPILFLIGSLVLAVLGNGVYELLRAALGVPPTAIVAGGLVLIGIVATAFWVLLWTLWRRAARLGPVVPLPQRAEPHAGLILLVGPNPGGAETPAVATHAQGGTLRHCWLIVTPEVEGSAKYQEFRAHVARVGAETHPVKLRDANQAADAYAAVTEAIRRARAELSETPFIVDITAGTKPMTAGAVLACRDWEAPMEYMIARRKPDGSVDIKVPPQAMQVVLGEAVVRQGTDTDTGTP